MLIQIFDAADANGLVAGNPARKAKIIRDKDGTLSEPRYEKDAFDDEEVELLKKNLPHNLTGYSIRVMLDSGPSGSGTAGPLSVGYRRGWLEIRALPCH